MKEPEQGNSNKAKSSIYTLWIAEAEVAPTKNDDSKWDVDGTAPDLSAMIVWKDQVILNTVSSDDSLIGRWDPIAISVGDVMKGEVSTSTVKRIARIRAEKDIKFSIIDDYKFNGDLLEAQMFAYIGVRSIKKLILSSKSTTGVKKSISGGKLYKFNY